MDRTEIRKYQLTQLGILADVDEICKQLHINYYLIGGTLLGAVRHGGFIPWDADVDIAMKRRDYETFRRYWESLKDETRYFYQHYTTDSKHRAPHAVLRIKGTHVTVTNIKSTNFSKNDGIFLDIFPLDYAPNDEKKQRQQARYIKFIKKMIYYKSGTINSNNSSLKKIIKKFLQLLLSPIGFRFLSEKMDGIMQKYNDNSSGYLVSMGSHYSYQKQLMKEEVYGDPVLLKFEDNLYYCPEKTDAYLSQLYGDYMTPPPAKDQFGYFENINVDFGEKTV